MKTKPKSSLFRENYNRSKLDNSVIFWDKCHIQYDIGSLKEETCWDRFADQFFIQKGLTLDLACGTGSDSLWLKNHGFRSAACDFSPAGLKLFHAYLPAIPVICFDMTKPFPFRKESFDTLICDMGLHFFSEKETFSILKETGRILKKGGTAFFRVNAIEDADPDKIAAEIEPHFYTFKDDVNMRYFSQEDIDRFFGDWSLYDAERTQMTRYGAPRETWILRCHK